jgi:hypothetical protein
MPRNEKQIMQEWSDNLVREYDRKIKSAIFSTAIFKQLKPYRARKVSSANGVNHGQCSCCACAALRALAAQSHHRQQEPEINRDLVIIRVVLEREGPYFEFGNLPPEWP